MSSHGCTHLWRPALSSSFILDWDGVLAETKLSFAHIREKYFQGRFVPLFESIETLPAETAKALEKDIYNEEMRGAEIAEAVPGAFELVEWLQAKGIPWCVVSRNCFDSIRLAAQKAGLSLPSIVYSRDTPPVKPSPEALWRAAEDMKVHPSGCLMIGDFVYDLVGARRAGMRAVLVQRPGVEWEHWADASFDRLLDFVEVLKREDSLPAWEYRTLQGSGGDAASLEALAGCALSMPDSREDILSVCMKCAARGVLNFHLEGEGTLGAAQWFEIQGLSPEWLDMPVKEVLKHLLGLKYPLARVIDDMAGFTALRVNEAGEPEVL
ncbi:MAG: HAD-IA family hydrolase [Synergistota bacterium]|nr:HAD-IA family hydrolase [Synergistota bacterium]